MKCWLFASLSNVSNSQEGFSNTKYYVSIATQKITSQMYKDSKVEMR